MYAGHLSEEAEQDIQSLFQAGRPREYKKGELVIHGSDPRQDIYYIKKGFVKVYSLNNRGEAYVQLIYGSGDIFPLHSLNGTRKSNLYFEAISPCELLWTSQADLKLAIGRSLSLANAFLEKTIEQFSIYIDRLDNLQYKYVQERLIYRILFLAQRFGVKQTDGTCLIAAPISQQLIASSINVSRENVSRELERLQKKGSISYLNQRIVIQHMDDLRKALPGQLNFEND